jgi:ATP-dependent exoDNAse (exonuclease V) beta subunit
VVDQARAWSEVSHGGLRAYLAWAAHQGQETSRVAESVLPETDAQAVRIMTVHAAKGLEFPIVILSGMTSRPNNARGVRLLWPSGGGYEVRMASGVQTGDFDAAVPVDEQMDEQEKRRLLYVAATRARDHLVVSLHRAAGSKAVTSAQLLAGAGGATAAEATAFSAPERPAPAQSSETPASPPPDYHQWLRGVQEARDRSRAASAITASGLEGTEPAVVLDENETAPGRAKGPRDLELPPWSKGRYGSDVGRAVHAVLQVVALDGSGLDQAVAAQCVAEGVVGQEGLVRDLARSALHSDLVRRAAAREHWRETYVGTERDDGTVLEGYIDLVYRDDNGTLVVVDYKTDALPTRAIAARTAYYKPQLDAYAECLAAATGAAVRTVLLFLHPEGSIEAPVP